jgi:predicted phosphoribosyltransferase
LEIAFVNRTDIYRQAIKRTFADLYGVSSDTVDVAGRMARALQCAGETFLHPILGDPDDDTPEFTCVDEDPVIVNLTDDERSQIERPI